MKSRLNGNQAGVADVKPLWNWLVVAVAAEPLSFFIYAL